MDSDEGWDVENGITINRSSDEPIKLIKTAHILSCSSLRKKSNPALALNSGSLWLKHILINLQEVVLGTKICFLFLAIPLAIVARVYDFGSVSVSSPVYLVLDKFFFLPMT